MTATDREFQQLGARVDALVQELARDGGAAGERARELARHLMRLYGEGLSRIVAAVEREGADTRRRLLDTLASDDLVSSLLLLHELHPHDTRTRIARGLERVAHLCGATLRLDDPGPEAVRVTVDGPLNAWSAPADVRRAIEEVVRAVAPDAGRIAVEGLPEPAPEPLVALQRRRPDLHQPHASP